MTTSEDWKARASLLRDAASRRRQEAARMLELATSLEDQADRCYLKAEAETLRAVDGIIVPNEH
jgi:hypothetical protein